MVKKKFFPVLDVPIFEALREWSGLLLIIALAFYGIYLVHKNTLVFNEIERKYLPSGREYFDVERKDTSLYPGHYK